MCSLFLIRSFSLGLSLRLESELLRPPLLLPLVLILSLGSASSILTPFCSIKPEERVSYMVHLVPIVEETYDQLLGRHRVW